MLPGTKAPKVPSGSAALACSSVASLPASTVDCGELTQAISTSPSRPCSARNSSASFCPSPTASRRPHPASFCCSAER